MFYPPRKFRMITPLFTVSGPLSPENVTFLKHSGCRKLVTVGGGFVAPDVVSHLKENQMEAVHYSFTPFDHPDASEASIDRIFDYIVESLSSGSRIHIAGDVSVIDIATLVGCFRRVQGWHISNAISEALELSDNVETTCLIKAISDFDVKKWSNKGDL